MTMNIININLKITRKEKKTLINIRKTTITTIIGSDFQSKFG